MQVTNNHPNSFLLHPLMGYALLSFVLYSVLTGYGCHAPAGGDQHSGRIIYDVSVEEDGGNPTLGAMLPSEIVTYFDGNKTATVMSMAAGQMKTTFISDADQKVYTTLIKALGKKVAMVLDSKQVEDNFSDHPPLQVRFTDEVAEFAGVRCTKVEITDSTNHTYDVYYTDAFGTAAFNWSTPFREINGMLMDYSIRLSDVVLKLKAKEIVYEPVEQTVFSVPEEYEVITDPEQLLL